MGLDVGDHLAESGLDVVFADAAATFQPAMETSRPGAISLIIRPARQPECGGKGASRLDERKPAAYRTYLARGVLRQVCTQKLVAASAQQFGEAQGIGGIPRR